MSGGATAGFAVRHARQIQAMLDEVNSMPPARVAVSGSPRGAAALADALAGSTDGAVDVLTGAEAPHSLSAYTALIVAIDEWPVRDRDVGVLRAGERAAMPIVVALLGLGESARRDAVPYVPSTDVISAETAADGLPAIVEHLAARLKADAYLLARALPQLRAPVSKAIVRHYARRNGLVAAAAIVPGADLPVLAINQLRMVARLAAAYGIRLDNKRLTELGVVVGASLGMRSVARTALALLPGPGRAIKGGVALSGTTAIGEAALRRFRSEANAVTTDCYP